MAPPLIPPGSESAGSLGVVPEACAFLPGVRFQQGTANVFNSLPDAERTGRATAP